MGLLELVYGTDKKKEDREEQMRQLRREGGGATSLELLDPFRLLWNFVSNF